MRFKLLAVLSLLITMTGCGPNIWTAVEKEDVATIKRYAEGGGDLDTGATLYCKTPLRYALEKEKQKSYQALLDAGANPNTLCRGGMSVMHLAANMKDSFWLKQALAAKGDPNLMNSNASNSYRATPIWYAMNINSLENVRLLLDAGADVNADIHGEMTAFAYSCDLGTFDMGLFLLQRKADYLKPADYGATAMFHLQSKIRVSKSGILTKDQLKALEMVVEWLKKDGFDPEKVTWLPEKSTWRSP